MDGVLDVGTHPDCLRMPDTYQLPAQDRLTAQEGVATMSILAPGRNCWRIEHAPNVAMLTNQDYFRALASSLAAATKQVTILGWELDAKLKLDPRSDGPAALPLARYLRKLLAEKPELEIRVLMWDRTIFFGGNRKARRLVAIARREPRLSVKFVAPGFLASLHHKMVCIDDCITYVGGIDITGDRWDRRDHPPEHPRRVTPDGEVYGPIHDLQMVLDGDAARAMGDVARQWWQRHTGETVQPVDEICPPWPEKVPSEFRDVRIAISRTDPYEPAGAVREIELLNRDCLTAAKRYIYLEAQYLTAPMVGDILCDHLRRLEGPEIVVIVTRSLGGLLEKFAMYNAGNRLVRRLREADRFGRLRVYHPTVGNARGGVQIKVHAKLIVIDDCFIRIGSSNLNNRSMGLDVECDIAMESADPVLCDAIAAKRSMLLAQQLGRKQDEVHETLHRTGSLIATIEELNTDGKLKVLPAMTDSGTTRPMPFSAILDPSEPVTREYLKRQWLQAPRPLRHA